MKTLNLVHEDKSDIKYKKIQFPDGQNNIVINNEPDVDGNKLPGYYYWAGKSRVYTLDSIQIKSRLNNFKDLELIICAAASLRELGVEEIHLYTPYILGSRSDRKFEEGGNNYLKDVICPVINSLNFKTVTCIDPHSDVLEACIKGFRKESNNNLVKFFLENKTCGINRNLLDDKFILIAPDGGSLKKIYKLAEQIGYKGDIVTCSKDRDTDGKLTKTVVPFEYKHLNKDIIVIDDIGDRFGTFINIAKVIRNQSSNFTGKLYLIVTHSIQQEGIIEALKYYDNIYSTNSYNDFNILNFKQLNIF